METPFIFLYRRSSLVLKSWGQNFLPFCFPVVHFPFTIYSPKKIRQGKEINGAKTSKEDAIIENQSRQSFRGYCSIGK